MERNFKCERIISLMLVLCMMLSYASINVFANDEETINFADYKAGTYDVDATLSCFVSAMGGVEFGSALLEDTKVTVSDDGKASITLSFGKSKLTIYGIDANTYVGEGRYLSGKKEPAIIGYQKSDETWVTDESVTYTLSGEGNTVIASYDDNNDGMKDNVQYIKSMTFPIEKANDTYQLALVIDSDFMGMQFGADSKYAATLTVDWSTFTGAKKQTINFADYKAGTYDVDAALSCLVSAMGGVEFGTALLEDTKVTVSDDGKASITLSFGKSKLTIYGIDANTYVGEGRYLSGKKEPAIIGYQKSDETWVTDESVTYTLSGEGNTVIASYDDNNDGMKDNVQYIKSMTFPIEKANDTYQLALVIDSDFMGMQFGADSKYAATLTVDWSTFTGTKNDKNDGNDDNVNEAVFGSAKTALAAGEYNLPVSMKKATDITTASMAASCISGATLTVGKDGKAELTVNIQPVNAFGIVGYSSDWKIYQTYSTEGTPVAAEYTTDADGNVTSITFDIPDNSWDGVYANIYVDVMDMKTNAYLAFDYASLAKNEQTYEGKAHVAQFGGYDVSAKVTVVDGIITKVELEGSNFGGSYADTNKQMLQKAIDAMKNAFNGKDASNAEDVYNVDVESDSAYSRKAIRAAVMNALGLEIKEVINIPENALEKGEYEVNIAFYTDNVYHSLVENDTAKAKIVADDNGKLTLKADIINGTKKEPLYVTEFNGYYKDNNKENELVMTGASAEKSDISFADDYFSEDTKVVSKVSVPLEGEYAIEYKTNMTIYVPSMNKLNGEVSGINFENGKFNVDCIAKIYWDSIKKIDTEEKPDITKDGKYTVKFALWHETQDQASMGNKAFEANPTAVITTKDGVSTIKIKTNPVTIGAVTSGLKNMRFENADGQIQYVTTIAKKNMKASDGTNKYDMEYISELEFALASADEMYIPVSILVPYTPMGDDYIDARLKIDWSTLKIQSDEMPISIASVEKTSDGNIDVSVENSGEDIQSVKVIAVYYDEQGKYIGMKAQDGAVSAGTSIISIDDGVNENASSIKVMIWDSFGGLVPLASSVEK